MNNLTPEELKLLDQFSVLAMQVIYSNPSYAGANETVIAKDAYLMATAMLKTRREILFKGYLPD